MQLVLLQSVFQLAVERFGLYMLLQGLGRIYTAQRAVEPLSLYGGVGGESSTGRCPNRFCALAQELLHCVAPFLS